MKSIVGFTGFVGSNLIMQTSFDGLFNSKNIEQAYNTKPDLLVYSGIRAEKYLANAEPERDFAHVQAAVNNIKKINPRKLVLISTVDVYNKPLGVYEDSLINKEELHAYGLNRLFVEEWVERNVDDYLILRLPGLYGENLKKNYIYDLINLIPSLLNEAKYNELTSEDRSLAYYYEKQETGFYKCKDLTREEKVELKNRFNQIGFSAVYFTDSRSVFQFYNLANLWEHIEIALKHNLNKVNIATEPVGANDIYKQIKGLEFKNEISQNPPHYDMRTKNYDLFGGFAGYILPEAEVLEDIQAYINGVVR